MEKVKGPKLDKEERRKIGGLSLLLISDSDLWRESLMNLSGLVED